MKRQRENSSDVSKASPPAEDPGLRDLSESHQMTLHRPLTVEGEKLETFSTNPIEYHLTIRLTHETLSRRELSLLLEVLCYQVVRWGVNLSQYLVMSELYFRLLGGKKKASEVKEPKVRLTLVIAEIILRSLRSIELPMDPRFVVRLPDSVRTMIQPGLMTSRTYGSRYKTWRPEKFFVVRIVPVDILLLERRKGSEPYSGYCKGYGESHPSAHSQKTKPSQELDGATDEELKTSEEEFIFQRCTDPTHVLCEYLVIKYRNETGVSL